jgi:hypothetical protein
MPVMLVVVMALAVLATPAAAGELTLRLPLGLQEQAAWIPDDNPLTHEKIALGKQLFWDKRWSRNGTVACVSCHDPNHGWADPRRFSTRWDGTLTPRHSPTLVNRLFSDVQQWAGTRASLEDQVAKASDQTPRAAGQESREHPWIPGAVPEGLRDRVHTGRRGQGHRGLRADDPVGQRSLRSFPRG